MARKHVGITVVGKDREGLVAAFTGFVFSKGGNIEAVNQNVIRGLFGMYLEASFSDMDAESFDSELLQLARREEMDVNIYHASRRRHNIAVFCDPGGALPEKLGKGRLAKVAEGPHIGGGGHTGHPEKSGRRGGHTVCGGARKGPKEAEVKLLDVCRQYDVDLIVLARYMRILTPNFVWRYPRRIINIHPSLLPAFPGAYAYQQAYERGTKIVGVTSHYVTENLDQGP